MFNLKEYYQRRTKNWICQTQINGLQAQINEIQREISDFNETCTHDLVINFGKAGPFQPDTGYAICACCGKNFHLKEESEDVRPEAVLDIVGKVPDTYFYTYCNDEKVIITRIKDKLLFVSSEPEIPMDMLKQILIEDLILFTEQKNKASEERLERIRKQKK